MRFNLIQAVTESVRTVVKSLNKSDVNTSQTESLRSLEEKIPAVSASQYGSLSDDEKMQVVNVVDHIAREALGILTNSNLIDEHNA